MIQDQIVFGVTDIQLKERLLHESSDLTLEKAATISRAGEASSIQIKKGKTWEPATVTAQHAAPRSYIVTTHDGTSY